MYYLTFILLVIFFIWSLICIEKENNNNRIQFHFYFSVGIWRKYKSYLIYQTWKNM